NKISQEDIQEIISKKFSEMDDDEVDILFEELRNKDVVFTDELIDDEDDVEEDEDELESLSAEEMQEQIQRSKRIASNAKTQTTVKYRVGGISNDTKVQDIIKSYFHQIGSSKILSKDEEVEYAIMAEDSD